MGASVLLIAACGDAAPAAAGHGAPTGGSDSAGADAPEVDPGTEDTAGAGPDRGTGTDPCGPPAPAGLGPAPDLELPHGVPDPEYLDASLCQQFCHWNAHCNDPLSTGDCDLDCQLLLQTGRRTNVACYVSSCNAEACLTAAPLPVPAACETFCEGADQCSGLLFFGIPPDHEACRALCAGKVAAFSSFEQGLDCAGPTMASCDVDAALACLSDGAVFCPHLCEEVDGCEGLPFEQAYPTKESCYQACDPLPPELAYLSMVCFDRGQCDAGPECFEPALEPGCEAWAQAMLDACGELAWPPTVGTAAAACSALARLHGMQVHPDPVTCFESYPRCPGTSVASLPCAFAPPAECAPLCERFCECSLMNEVGCGAQCVDNYLGVGFHGIEHDLPCLDAATCDYFEYAACFVDEEGADVWDCEGHCDAVASCPGTAIDYAACVSGCVVDTKDGERSWFAQMYCMHEGGGGCDAVDTCLAADLPLESEVCATACKEVAQVCHHWPIGFDTGATACELACAQILAAHGAAGAASHAACVAPLLDHDCLSDALPSCF